MLRFTSAMLDVIEHCASEAEIDSERRSVCAADMRDAYDLLIRKLARAEPSRMVGEKSALISMALDDKISEVQQLLADQAPDNQITGKLQAILTTISHLRK